METIQQSIEQLHGALRDYIEATYHISAKSLIHRRKALLNTAGIIHQIPLPGVYAPIRNRRAFSRNGRTRPRCTGSVQRRLAVPG